MYNVSFFILFFSQSEDPVNRTITMVIINVTFGIVFKSLSAYASFYDFYHMAGQIQNINLNQKFDFGIAKEIFLFKSLKFCSYQKVCASIERLASLLYFVLLSLFLLFYFKFDKKFRFCFKQTFTKQIKI